MRKKGIATTMRDVLIERGEIIVSQNCISVIDECAKRSGLNRNDSTVATKHPLRTMNTVLEALDDSDLFINGFIKTSTGFVKAYKLK